MTGGPRPGQNFSVDKSEPRQMALPAGFFERLQTQIKLTDVISRWVRWDMRKSNPAKGDYWASCPFHDEKTASFHVDDRKGFYYCFGCRAKGDAASFLQEKQGIGFNQAVRNLAFLAGMEAELMPAEQGKPRELPALIQLKDLMVEYFDQENFLELGVMTGWTQQIRSHPRLLRSLSWGDPDFPACVLDLISRMDEAQDGSIEKLQDYVAEKFAVEAQAASEAVVFSAAKKTLGYNFMPSRNDVIGVMMPFQSSFSAVYDTIKASCETTPLPAKRADEVWNHSVLINDILELINHSAVVICDLTGRNENVFYELGIAHAWGKPVIPITQNAEDVPFDLRHHRYVRYLNNSEGLAGLQGEITRRLQSLLGERPWY